MTEQTLYTNYLKITLLLLLFSMTISCKNNNSKSNPSSSKCTDTKSYKIGKQEGDRQRINGQKHGQAYSCGDVWRQFHPNTNKSCFCEGFEDAMY